MKKKSLKKSASKRTSSRKNYAFKKPTIEALRVITEQTGKSETTAIADLIAGCRLFSPEVEAFITDQQAVNPTATRWQLIQEAIRGAMTKKNGDADRAEDTPKARRLA